MTEEWRGFDAFGMCLFICREDMNGQARVECMMHQGKVHIVASDNDDPTKHAGRLVCKGEVLNA
jgi:hypothetical protein